MNANVHRHTTFLPTGKCFDDALDYLEAVARRSRSRTDLESYQLVHGICAMADGELYSHAWVEQGAEVIHGALLPGHGRVYLRGARDWYYAEYRVREFTRYTVEQAWAENARTNHYGPWVEKYQRLCSDYDSEGVKT